MQRRVKIVVSGRVQGVYFRMFTQNKAKHFAIQGTVRNLPDGRVEIIAEAEQSQLDKLIKWCHRAPITARVTNVEVLDVPINDVLEGFKIV